MKTDNILLIIVLIFIGLCVWNGYKKGFLKIALSMAAMVATIIFVGIVNPYVSKFLMVNTSLYTVLEESTSGFIDEMLENQVKQGLITRTDEVFAIDHLALPKSIRETLIENNHSDFYEMLGVNDFKAYLSSYLACMILNAISFIGTFLIAGFIIRIIFVMADIIGRIPGIKGVNKLAGLAVGFLESIVILWICCLVITAFAGTQWGRNILAMIQDSVILSFIYNNNLLMVWVTDLIKMLV